jgi:O-antigen/teichoic acid export membrane protein
MLSRSGLIDWRPGIVAFRNALRFGAPLLPHSLAAVAMSTIDRFALSGSVGTSATGEYFAAFQIAALLTVASGAVNQAWTPWLYGRLARKTEDARHEIVRTTWVLCVALLLGGCAMAIAAPFIVHIVAGARFASAGSLLVFLAPAAAFRAMYYFVTGYLFYSGRTGVLSTITAIAACLQAALTFALVRSYGAPGVAFASLVSSILYFFMTAIAANRVMPMPWLTFGRVVPVNAG